ncbi:MAG TPA: GntR family transcriptional regulator [Herpetosiphonaceae bacterium]|nr:GntR family transcriptional regulator [Herpetosiphonaceae bacterium]
MSFGPRAQRVHTLLRERIAAGELAVGAKLPAHTALAVEYGVSPLTMRQVLAHLEAEGLVSREHGRGTFVRAPALPAVLIVEDDASMRALLEEYVTRGGYRPVAAPTAAEGLAHLVEDRSIALVFSDVRVPDMDVGRDFIRTVRRRWPALPLVAITGYPRDLDELVGTPDWPVLILSKPFWPHQIEETLRLVLRP